MIAIYTWLWLSFIIGIIMGIVDAWKEKVMFFIWLGFIAFLVFAFIYQPSTTFSEIYIYGWWQLPLQIALMVLGMKVGARMYKITFEKKQ